MDSHERQPSLAAGQRKEKVLVRPSAAVRAADRVCHCSEVHALALLSALPDNPQDRTFLCTEALITGALQKGEEEKSHISGHVEGFRNSNQTK